MAINSKTMAYGLVKDIKFMVGIWRQVTGWYGGRNQGRKRSKLAISCGSLQTFTTGSKRESLSALEIYEVAKVTYAHNFFQQPRARLCMVLFVIVKYATWAAKPPRPLLSLVVLTRGSSNESFLCLNFIRPAFPWLFITLELSIMGKNVIMMR